MTATKGFFEYNENLTPILAAKILLNAHYYLIKAKTFWYDKADQEASKILCVRASALRHNDNKYLGETK